MRPGKRLLLFIPLLLGVLLIVLLLAGVPIFGTIDPLFHGKPESQWINELTYDNETQYRRWHDFGPEGVQVLIRGFDHADRPAGLTYQRILNLLPGWITRWLKSPPRTRSPTQTRVFVLSLLNYHDVSNAALQTVSRALGDGDPAVRYSAISYFTSDRYRLQNLTPDQKLALLPVFLRLTHDPDQSVRGSALGALSRYTDFPEQRSVIVAALRLGMDDPYPLNRFIAVNGLSHVAPEMMGETGATNLLIQYLGSTDEWLAIAAARQLGRDRNDSDLAIPALTKRLTSSNSSIPLARASVFALTNFLGQTNLIVPALEVAASRPDVVGESAREALEFIRSHQP